MGNKEDYKAEETAKKNKTYKVTVTPNSLTCKENLEGRYQEMPTLQLTETSCN